MWPDTLAMHYFIIVIITAVISGVVIAKLETSYFSPSQPSESSTIFADGVNDGADRAEDSPMLALSEKSVTKVACLLLERMANKFGGDCTLNELRVMNAVSVHSFSEDPCSPTILSRVTGIPKSTVSRSLASLVSKGWLVEHKDTQDRRRRIIELSDKALSQRADDLQAIFDLINTSGH